jgi:hypothetical protein
MLLASNGFGEESTMIQRVIYELLQHLAYININTDEKERNRKTRVWMRLEFFQERFSDADLLRTRGWLKPDMKQEFPNLTRKKKKIDQEPDLRKNAKRWRTLEKGDKSN